MVTIRQTCENCVASAHIKFFCVVTEILNEYDGFIKERLKWKERESEGKEFSEEMAKRLVEGFKEMQKVVGEKIKERGVEKNSDRSSVSFEYSDVSASPETPQNKAPERFTFKTQQVKLKVRRRETQTSFATDRKAKEIKRNYSQANLARCLFIN